MKTLLVTIILLLIQTSQLLADYKDPTAKTNVNEVDTLFQSSTSNYKDLEQSLENSKNAATQSIKDQKSFSNIEGSKNAASTAKELSNIRPGDLEARGREEYARNPQMNDYFVDYSKPGNSLHKSDAERIANASGKVMNDLVSSLKDLKVDCKTQKGNKEVEPEYLIEIEKKQHPKGDTVYDKFTCDHLRNKYSCKNTVTVNCKRKAMRWGAWQERRIDLIGCNVYAYSRNWTYTLKWKKRRYGVHIKVGDAEVNRQIQHHIAGSLSIHPDHIGDVRTNARGYGGEPAQAEISGKDYYWPKYLVHYKYRDGQLVCQEWNESWAETCLLN
ncbi:MAG: hypothetical protein EOP45_01320 [Sphingobacteriaceae bacterium]|nr:MAG: hypothetical protein EOP45_01320 [Sphingobacteriaceae bacterium]